MKLSVYKCGLLFAAVSAFFAVGRGQSAGSAPIYEVKFEKGVYINKGTVQPTHPCLATGPTDCGSGNSTSLSLKGLNGMHIRIRLTSETGGAIFSILLPNQNPMKDSSGVTSWNGTLPS
ncbi:MAG: hypothetical protein ACREO5_10655, partial [Candidatus Binatia bacterium]